MSQLEVTGSNGQLKSFDLDMSQGFVEVNHGIMKQARQLGLSAISAGEVMRFVGSQSVDSQTEESTIPEVDHDQLVLW